MSRLANGARLYPLSTLRQYADEDLKLLDRVKPDVVVGDFRLSLSVSARVAGIPYVALSNAYWSPYASRRRIPMPSLPMARILGVPLASAFFTLGRPFAFAWHTVPLNLLRREYGLPGLGLDLRRVYTDADMTLYADVPELVPTAGLPDNHRYIGPVEWSPELPMPELPAAAAQRPLVYVTLGSSGSGALLPVILEALSELDCHVAVASAGALLDRVPANATVADYLPGAQMSARAALVICNGGSPTSHQALACGVPVLGIPFNLDQHLNMDCVVAYGAGLALRPEHANALTLRSAAQTLLTDPQCRRRAAELRRVFVARRAAGGFQQALDAAIIQHTNAPRGGKP
ncbi:MAG TPA: nucleotide disphospho-sugar-binding domain-containing protein [Aromatoleum sp.]|uniref:glycosyltransferase n=1 Tax=Aromatoleum sp. TaxID=2307007 RepID=UPI002B490144|nr:nucleotide disphospho-sugar-binding domain-containing protein [Aromatoleum sp.]HJV26880.1 nucleotide disphospho-sugar-binding domain-containing protein [Aromatoleum sp.]